MSSCTGRSYYTHQHEASLDLTYEEKPIRVLVEMERVTWSKIIKFYKVVWNNHSEQDATWEREDYLREVYPAFFQEW